MANEIVESIESLQDFNRTKLRELADSFNAGLGLSSGDLGFMKKSGNKGDLIDRILQSDALNTDPSNNTVESDEQTKLKASQLLVNDRNFRHEVDYKDPAMQAEFRNSDFKFFHDLKVTPTGTQNNTGEEQYRIVSGNRSFSVFLATCMEDGLEPNDYDIPVSIRTYGGTDAEQRVSELRDIALANDLQRSHSPIDRCIQYNELRKAGLSQESIAEIAFGPAAKGKQTIISQISRLRLLPKRVQDLVHFQHQRHVLASYGAEFLEENNIPFNSNEEGAVTEVLGITVENAKNMNKLWPRPNDDERDAREVQVIGLLNRDDVVENAISMTSATFNSWLRN